MSMSISLLSEPFDRPACPFLRLAHWHLLAPMRPLPSRPPIPPIPPLHPSPLPLPLPLQCNGFGAGNFKSLFESIERTQAERGNLTADEPAPAAGAAAGGAGAAAAGSK